jgi:hypothetical protein
VTHSDNAPRGLTVAMRSCMLRASRKRLEQLHADYEAAAEHGDLGSHKEELFAEIGCVTAAIAWLWQQPAVDDK